MDQKSEPMGTKTIFQASLVAAKGEIAKRALSKSREAVGDKKGVMAFFDDVYAQLGAVIDHMFGDKLTMRRKPLRADAEALQIFSKGKEKEPVLDLVLASLDGGRSLMVSTYEILASDRLLPKETVAFFRLSDDKIMGLRVKSGMQVSAADEVGALLSYVAARLPRVPEGKSLPAYLAPKSTDDHGLQYL